MNDLISVKLKEIANLQDILNQMSNIINQNTEKFLILVNILCLLCF